MISLSKLSETHQGNHQPCIKAMKVDLRCSFYSILWYVIYIHDCIDHSKFQSFLEEAFLSITSNSWYIPGEDEMNSMSWIRKCFESNFIWSCSVMSWVYSRLLTYATVYSSQDGKKEMITSVFDCYLVSESKIIMNFIFHYNKMTFCILFRWICCLYNCKLHWNNTEREISIDGSRKRTFSFTFEWCISLI